MTDNLSTFSKVGYCLKISSNTATSDTWICSTRIVFEGLNISLNNTPTCSELISDGPSTCKRSTNIRSHACLNKPYILPNVREQSSFPFFDTRLKCKNLVRSALKTCTFTSAKSGFNREKHTDSFDPCSSNKLNSASPLTFV